MTAHALAKLLLSGPDLPVVISTGSVEDEPMEIEGQLTEFAPGVALFNNGKPSGYEDRSAHVELR